MAQARLYKMITPPKFKGGGITVKVGDKVVTQPAAGLQRVSLLPIVLVRL